VSSKVQQTEISSRRKQLLDASDQLITSYPAVAVASGDDTTVQIEGLVLVARQ
jgi:hypothetical protein